MFILKLLPIPYDLQALFSLTLTAKITIIRVRNHKLIIFSFLYTQGHAYTGDAAGEK